MQTVSIEKYNRLKCKAEAWKERSEELETAVVKLSEEIKSKPTSQLQIDKMQLDMDRVIFKKDAEIERLKNNLSDLRDRYNELKDDFREYKK
jgi:chromosome segregation ATPase